MSGFLNVLLGRQSAKDCQAYTSDELLFGGLQAEESGAIRCLYTRVAPFVYKIARNGGLPDTDIEELIGDAIATLLLKIRSGAYVFQGYSPATFAVEVAKNKMMHRLRKLKKQQMEPLSEQFDQAEEEDNNPANWEAVEQLNRFLNAISPGCQQLIRLKYLEEKRDKEVIEQQLTPYTTVDALKTHRARCMKKLVEMATSAMNR